jgi:hypothetical protein
MTKRIWILAITSSFCLGMTVAQNLVLPSCPRTLKQSPEAFLKSRPNNASEQEAAALYWAGCKGEQNTQRLRRYPKLAARLARLRGLEVEFSATQLSLANLKNHSSVDNTYASIAPSLQLHFEVLIRLTTSKAGAVTNASIRSRYAKAKLEIESRIARVIAKPYQYGQPGPNPDFDFEMEKMVLQWRKKEVLTYQKAYRKILALIGSRQNAASLEVLEFLNTSHFAQEI